jgi:predicted CXXCH cytochrome family protein
MARPLGIAAAGALLLLCVTPTIALADNGPHERSQSLTTGQCAGCHRVHTAQSSKGLLKVAQSQLCYSCHGGIGAGASTNVQFGYAKDGLTGLPDGADPGGAMVGALRAGGFATSWIASGRAYRPMVLAAGSSQLDPGVYGTTTSWTPPAGMALPPGVSLDANGQLPANYTSTSVVSPDGRTILTKVVPVAAAGAPTTSAHSLGVAGSTAWGNGGLSSAPDAGRTGVTLECGSCHDPHGNGNYRILKPVPNDSGIGATTHSITGIEANAGGPRGIATLTTATDHGFVVGQTVVIRDVRLGGSVPYAINGPQVISAIPGARQLSFLSQYATSAGPISGSATAAVAIADSTSGQTYTTDNYWSADTTDTGRATQDVYLGGTAHPGQSAFITSISAWCSTCHTRYAAASGPRGLTGDGVDGIYTHRHTSTQNIGDASADFGTTSQPQTPDQRTNCIQCHVAHGSSAVMSGEAGGQAGNGGQNPDGTSNPTPGKLLRVDGRGTCRMCHAAQGNS